MPFKYTDLQIRVDAFQENASIQVHQEDLSLPTLPSGREGKGIVLCIFFMKTSLHQENKPENKQ